MTSLMLLLLPWRYALPNMTKKRYEDIVLTFKLLDNDSINLLTKTRVWHCVFGDGVTMTAQTAQTVNKTCQKITGFFRVMSILN